VHKEFYSALLLSREKGVGASTFRDLLEMYLKPSVALEAWQSRTDLVLGKVSLEKAGTAEKIREAMAGIERGDYLGFYYGQEGYPAGLSDLTEPPPVIFTSGSIRQMPMVAVVGARKIEPKSIEATQKIVEKYVKLGYGIVSGGALGVDTVAHETALRMGGYTVMVAGCGIDVDYPKANARLFAQIRKAGAQLSELMPGTQPSRGFFPTRNRIIAAMADIVVIVQAASKGGALITAKWGTKLGRQVLVVVPPHECEAFAGNRALIDSGRGETIGFQL
jgi:DNA processing protein